MVGPAHARFLLVDLLTVLGRNPKRCSVCAAAGLEVKIRRFGSFCIKTLANFQASGNGDRGCVDMGGMTAEQVVSQAQTDGSDISNFFITSTSNKKKSQLPLYYGWLKLMETDLLLSCTKSKCHHTQCLYQIME